MAIFDLLLITYKIFNVARFEMIEIVNQFKKQIVVEIRNFYVNHINADQATGKTLTIFKYQFLLIMKFYLHTSVHNSFEILVISQPITN